MGKGQKSKVTGSKAGESEEAKGPGKTAPKRGKRKAAAEDEEEEEEQASHESEDVGMNEDEQEEEEEEASDSDPTVRPKGFVWPDMDEERWATKPKDKVYPPAHVDGNHVYSSAYKKAQRAGFDLENAKKWGRYASQFYKKYAWVPQKYIGGFRKPKAKAKAKTAK